MVKSRWPWRESLLCLLVLVAILISVLLHSYQNSKEGWRTKNKIMVLDDSCDVFLGYPPRDGLRSLPKLELLSHLHSLALSSDRRLIWLSCDALQGDQQISVSMEYPDFCSLLESSPWVTCKKLDAAHMQKHLVQCMTGRDDSGSIESLNSIISVSNLKALPKRLYACSATHLRQDWLKMPKLDTTPFSFSIPHRENVVAHFKSLLPSLNNTSIEIFTVVLCESVGRCEKALRVLQSVDSLIVLRINPTNHDWESLEINHQRVNVPKDNSMQDFLLLYLLTQARVFYDLTSWPSVQIVEKQRRLAHRAFCSSYFQFPAMTASSNNSTISWCAENFAKYHLPQTYKFENGETFSYSPKLPKNLVGTFHEHPVPLANELKIDIPAAPEKESFSMRCFNWYMLFILRITTRRFFRLQVIGWSTFATCCTYLGFRILFMLIRWRNRSGHASCLVGSSEKVSHE